MAGRSPAMVRLFSQMRHTARHLRVATIEGESGTGKMLAARTLHGFGIDPHAPFSAMSAVQLVESQSALALIPSGSLALQGFSALPALQRSCGGTLVLTRVDDLSPACQARLLELFEWIDHQHTNRAVGFIPRQILCLSSQSLRRMAATGILRSDLASRLTAIRFAIPPLRDRREDIPILAEVFAERFTATHGKPIRGLSPQTLPHLMQHNWPGNVREFESVIYAAALACPGQWIRPIDLPALAAEPLAPATSNPAPDDNPSPDSSLDPSPDPSLDRAIMRHIHGVLARAEGNKFRAAKMLGISRSTLYRLLEAASMEEAS
jgi:DNA-binding NtrC family response regulator